MKYLLLVGTLACFVSSFTRAQMNIFAELVGNPVDITGWSMTHDATIQNDEVVFTPALNYKVGTLFFQTPIDFSNGGKFIVDFDFRIWDGNAADGIALNVLTQLPNPNGVYDGGGMGVDQNAVGLKVVFDTYDNDGFNNTPNPEIQVVNGTGYYEPSVPLAHRALNLSYLRMSYYQHARIVYDNGTVKVYVNCELELTVPNVTIQDVGYFGFSAATGGQTDRHSIKNARIYVSTNPSSLAVHAVCSKVAHEVGTPTIANTSYLWEAISSSDNINLLSDPTVSNPTFLMENNGTALIEQNYLLNTYLNINGCPDTLIDTVKVRVHPNPSIDTIVIEHIAYCDPTLTGKASATIEGGNGFLQYAWMFKADSSIVGTASVAPSLHAGDYIFTLTDSVGSQAAQEISVLYPPKPSVTIAANKNPICIGDTAILTATVVSNTYANIAWTHDPSINTNVLSVAPTQTADYTIIATESNGCKDSAMLTIDINSAPIANFADDPLSGCIPLHITIDNFSSGDIDSYLWILNHANKTDSIAQPTADPLAITLATEGCHDVTLLSYGKNGCVGVQTKLALVCPHGCEITAPNVLSLSSHEGNHLWFVKNMGYEDFHCQIINRWGELIYEYHNINEGWNGRNKKGNLVTQGVYFYKIEASVNGKTQTKHGTITLVY